MHLLFLVRDWFEKSASIHRGGICGTHRGYFQLVTFFGMTKNNQGCVYARAPVPSGPRDLPAEPLANIIYQRH